MSGPGAYDLPETARLLLAEKAKRRAFLREEFLKLKTNPFEHASGQAGTVFDPAIQRYNALMVNQFDYFKPSGRNALFGLIGLVVPMSAYFYLLYTSKNNQEAKYRRGEVAYADRNFKFI